MGNINKYSARIKEIRRMLGMTQQQLADRLLLSRNYIAKLELGLNEPSVRTISAMESLLVEKSQQPGATTRKSERELVSDEEAAAAFDVLRRYQLQGGKKSTKDEITILSAKITELQKQVATLLHKPKTRKGPYPGMTPIEIADSIEEGLWIPPLGEDPKPSSGHRSAL